MCEEMCWPQLLWFTKCNQGHRFRLGEKVELIKKKKSHGFNYDKIGCQWDPVLIERLVLSLKGSNVKVSESFKACSNHIQLIECLASRTLSVKISMLKMKLNIIYSCLCAKTRSRISLLVNNCGANLVCWSSQRDRGSQWHFTAYSCFRWLTYMIQVIIIYSSTKINYFFDLNFSTNIWYTDRWINKMLMNWVRDDIS